MKANLVNYGFDIVGVVDEDERVIGYAKTSELNNGLVGEYLNLIEINQIITDSTPISHLFKILLEKPFIFVACINEIGIITRSDINKPIVRLYIFGIISLFEMHLVFWVDYFFPDNLWVDSLENKRRCKAEKIYKRNQIRNQDLNLIECLEFSDKKNILERQERFLEIFDLSSELFIERVTNIIKLRDGIAHSKRDITFILGWKELYEHITFIEEFLNYSDCKIKNINNT